MSSKDDSKDPYLSAYAEIVREEHLTVESLASYVLAETVDPRLSAHIKLHAETCAQCSRMLQMANVLLCGKAPADAALRVETTRIAGASKKAQDRALALHRILSRVEALKNKLFTLTMPRLHIPRWETAPLEPVFALRGTPPPNLLAGVQTRSLAIGSNQHLPLVFFSDGILVRDTLAGRCEYLLVTPSSAIAGERHPGLPGYVMLRHVFEESHEYEIQGALFKDDKLVLLSLEEI